MSAVTEFILPSTCMAESKSAATFNIMRAHVHIKLIKMHLVTYGYVATYKNLQ